MTLFASWLLGASAADATGTSSRVWVSGHGVDQAGCGAPSAPCRSLQYALDNVVVAGGEIDILDPAGYGAITITKAVSIVNDGVGTAGIQSTGADAIHIAAGANDTIFLKGLNIDGLGTAGDGVAFLSGRELTITNCVIRHATSRGIILEPSLGASSNILISNTTLSDNAGGPGVSYVPSSSATASIVIDHVTSNSNGLGFFFNTAAVPGLSRVLISNSSAENNVSSGIEVIGGTASTLYTMIDMTISSHNAGDGVTISGGSDLRISRSTITKNTGAGVANNEAPNRVFSFGDNRIDGNTGGNAPDSPLQPLAFQ